MPFTNTKHLAILFLLLSGFVTHAQVWQTVGNPEFSVSEAMYPLIALDKNDTPYIAFADYSLDYKATVMKYDGSSWKTVGPRGFSTESTGSISFALNSAGTPYVAYSDGPFPRRATVMKYYNGNWIYVGSPKFSDPLGVISIAIDKTDTPYVVFDDETGTMGSAGRTTVMKYTDSGWVNVGSPMFSVQEIAYPSIAFDSSGTPYVAYSDAHRYNKATVMKYNGSSWDSVGHTGFSSGDVWYTSIAIDRNNVPYIAYVNIGDIGIDSFNVSVMKYHDSNWVTVGTGVSSGGARYTTLALDSSGIPYVAYEAYNWTTNTGGAPTVMKYTGGSWTQEGITGERSGPPSLTLDRNGIPYVAFPDGTYDTSMGRSTVMKLIAWTEVKNINKGTTSLALFPDPNCGSFTIKGSMAIQYSQEVNIEVMNPIGQVVYHKTIVSQNGTINEQVQMNSNLASGVYMVNIYSDAVHKTFQIIVGQ